MELSPSGMDWCTGGLGRGWADRPYVDLPDCDRSRAWLAQCDRELFLIAEEAGQPVGFVAAKIDRQAEIEDLCVVPEARRRGLGAALLADVIVRLRKRTELPIRLHTESADPVGALRLYRRLGFIEVHRHDRWRRRLKN